MRIRSRAPGNEYDSGSYRRAVQRAADAAGVEVWSPNQLRHSYATELLAERFEVLGKIGATLGHARPATTRRYTEALVAAMSIAREVG